MIITKKLCLSLAEHGELNQMTLLSVDGTRMFAPSTRTPLSGSKLDFVCSRVEIKHHILTHVSRSKDEEIDSNVFCLQTRRREK